MTIEQYVDLDEAVVLYYLKEWIKERDPILSDLARRFINRDLFKFLPFDGSIITMNELRELFEEAASTRITILSASHSPTCLMIMTARV